MIEVLIKHGADPAAKNDKGVTAVQLASEKGHLELARRLGAA
jgi:ankyrin repeat protein